jgi:hypothetical protein
MSFPGLALCWLREEDWPEWLSMDDAFEPDYGKWRSKMDTEFERLRASGVPCQKVVVTPIEFKAWAHSTGAGLDTGARAKFAMVKMMANERRQTRTG